ncbi:3-oxoacyl-ACP reductase [Halioglobus japonicus]|uniref:SDR family NAD(P)-dependent oxidoreductase n=1 Tax=Halioglobus japonicus TaxID=930805 RepID=A0AAP8SQ24_9GAMM|nr:SDR family NAD(P)-dependent oxidoreductase [Halioglobus japonicus]AQA19158.1 3-oxoacyl-ACP reductase [Halioglobus japonicus]PLW87813.1 SDR family NAD(P)-dependent oxidoreductase [Halioglobus japonicus]GHD06425.1 short-chain dehydrogenase [Halioglobus japonicus]
MMLKDKVALVTGAGQGVGQGIALALAAEGARVAVTGRTESKLETTCELIRERGGDALPVVCQVKDEASLANCVEAVVDHFGGLQILVNNAQEVPLGELHQVTDKAFIAGFESGPLATMRMMKLCYPHLKGDGCIINLGSSSAKRWDINGFGAYAATKEAIRALSRAAACEWGPEGIRTNVILPHAKSPGLEWWTREYPEQAEEFIQSIPQRRIGECEEDIGRFVALLCSEGSSYINGQSIAVDGGQSLIG